MAQNIPRILQGHVRVNLSATVKRTFERLEAECAAATQVSVSGNQTALNELQDSVSIDEGPRNTPQASQAEDSPGKKRKFGITIAAAPVINIRDTGTECQNSSFSIICDEDLPIFHDLRKLKKPSSTEESYSGTGDGDDDEVVCLTPPNHLELARCFESNTTEGDDDGESIFVLDVFPPRSQNSPGLSQTGNFSQPSPLQSLLDEIPASSQNDAETGFAHARV